MSKPLLIIISGPPCTGKTTLGQKIAKRFHLPFFSKDDIKVSLFEDLGWSDRGWSKKLSITSFHLLYYVMESSLQAQRSLIVEGNFKPETENKKFRALRKKYDFLPIQIQCQADGKITLERFKKRWESGKRHPGHVDNVTYDELKNDLLKGKLDSLDIGREILTVDTTKFKNIDYEKIYKIIRAAVKPNRINENSPRI